MKLFVRANGYNNLNKLTHTTSHIAGGLGTSNTYVLVRVLFPHMGSIPGGRWVHRIRFVWTSRPSLATSRKAQRKYQLSKCLTNLTCKKRSVYWVFFFLLASVHRFLLHFRRLGETKGSGAWMCLSHGWGELTNKKASETHTFHTIQKQSGRGHRQLNSNFM
jgi:hypothetical protein